MDPEPGFQGHDIFEVKYLKKTLHLTDKLSYYSTVIENHT